MFDLIPYVYAYAAGGAIAAAAFLLATIRHRGSREYWECVAVAFLLWPVVVAGVIVDQVQKLRRWRTR